MAEIQDPAFLQEGCTTAQGDRQVLSSLVCGEGIAFGNGDNLEVTDGPSGLQVVVGSGNAFIQGDTVGWQGMYHVSNDAPVTLTLDTADPTDDRIDIIIAQVNDSTYVGSADDWELTFVTGSASPSPVVPTVPDSALILAQVLVAAGATTLTSTDITDVRDAYSACGGLSDVEVVTYTATGTFEKADYPGAKMVKVTVQGGGGGGGASDTTAGGESAVGSGGSGGDCEEMWIPVTDLPASVTVQIGTGGSGGPGAGAGVQSSFVGFVIALGGEGGTDGTAGSTPDAVAGGPAPGGSVMYPGSPGGIAYRSDTPAGSFSGYGGDSHLGSGGNAAVTNVAGLTGTGYGWGGGGAKSTASAAAHNGADGGPGVVIVEVYR